MKSTILLVFLFSVSIASARIGETLSQCESRYGSPVIHNEEISIFHKTGLQIAVHFYQQKADALLFKKEEKDAIGRCVEISDDEILILLNANGSGWKKALLAEEWTSGDGLLSAGYGLIDHSLAFITKGYSDRTSAESERNAAKKLKDF